MKHTEQLKQIARAYLDAVSPVDEIYALGDIVTVLAKAPPEVYKWLFEQILIAR